jgi:hypothetical protein
MNRASRRPSKTEALRLLLVRVLMATWTNPIWIKLWPSDLCFLMVSGLKSWHNSCSLFRVYVTLPFWDIRGNVSLSAKNHLKGSVHLKQIDCNFLLYYFCLIINLYNAMNFNKRHTIQSKGLVDPQWTIAFSEVYVITKKWLCLTVLFT